MDEDFDAIYQDELRLGRLFTTFAALAIFIAGLGLFGLAAYAAEQRRKAGGHLVGGRCQQLCGGPGGRRVRRGDRRP